MLRHRLMNVCQLLATGGGAHFLTIHPLILPTPAHLNHLRLGKARVNANNTGLFMKIEVGCSVTYTSQLILWG